MNNSWLQSVCKRIAHDPYWFACWCEAIGLSLEVTPETTLADLALQYVRQRRAAV